MRKVNPRYEFTKDIIFILIGGFVALVLSNLGVVDKLVSLFGNVELASFVAGMFFTSVFTIAPASVALGHIAINTPSYIVALWGALGAVFGDLVIFYFIRDRFAEDFMKSFGSKFLRHILASFHVGFYKWLSPILGGTHHRFSITR